MNPRPMQFTMGAKMYQRGKSPVRDTTAGATKAMSSVSDIASGYEEVTGQVRGLGRYFKTPNGDIISANQLPKEIAIALGVTSKDFPMEGPQLSAEQMSQLEMLRRQKDSLDNPFGDDAQAIDEQIRQIRKGGSSATQTPGGVPAPIPPGLFDKDPEVGPMSPPMGAPRKNMDMGRLLKEYLKGGKTDAGLKALAASNPNLTYKEAMNGMRLIKDPVGMKSAGHGRKMYQDGTGSAEGGGQPERIDPNDPGFQEFLKATSGSYPYYPEYTGDPIGKGRTIKGKSKAGFDDVILGQHSMGTRDIAVNPELYTFPTSVEGPSYAEGGRGVDINYLQGPRSRIPGTGTMFPGATGDPATAITRGDAIQASIEKYQANLAAEQAYRDYLAKQKKGGGQGVRYETLPDGGFRIIGTQDQIDAMNVDRP